MTLERLALARSTLDRSAHRRSDPTLPTTLLTAPDTSVLLLDADRALVVGDRASVGLLLLDPAGAAELRDRSWHGEPDPLVLYLGDDPTGRPHVALARCPTEEEPADARAAQTTAPAEAPAGARWAGLRDVGALLEDRDAGILTTAVALANWHRTHPRCARCGAGTNPVDAGWARSCPACEAMHFPRTDPAVIMAVVHPDERILLGRQARWPQGRFSTLAGFVESGESVEAAVRREVLEEAGVTVGEVHYLGSQPWPFPSSLMLGFRATAESDVVTVDGVELAQARWWTREELALDIATGELLLPPPVSIARRLIEDWYGGPLHDDARG